MNGNKIITALLVGVFATTSCKKAAESFRIISPGGRVSLNNAEIADFIDDYYFGKSLEYIDKSKGDRYFPNSVGIKWNGVCGDYELTVSLSEDFSNAVTYNGEGFGAPIDGLFTGKTYFCKVKSSKDGKESEVKRFATERGPRTVKIDGVSNTRDIGGYPSGDKEIKQGMVYRGATPEKITAGGLKEFSALGIKTVIDLRERSSRNENMPGINYIDLPEKGGPCYARGDRNLSEEPFTSALVQSVKVFADESNYPIYFHCQIGRDRTGTLAFIINGLLGADEKDLALDYELSCFSAAGCVDYDDKNKQIEDMTTNFNGMKAYFIKYSQMKGLSSATVQSGIEAFLIDNGVTEEEITKIKEILLD